MTLAGFDTGAEKMGVFSVDTGTGAWEKQSVEVGLGHGAANTENGSIQQTMVFENTAYKGGKGDKLDKTGPIQVPLSFAKQDSDNADLKLDFTFGGGEDNSLKGQQAPLAIPKSLSASPAALPASPSTDDLQTKLANTKKLWDAPGSLGAVAENSSSWNESDLYSGDTGAGSEVAGDKTSDQTVSGASSHAPGVSNIAKVKPQQQLAMEGDTRASNAALQYYRMAVPSPPASHSLPPSQPPLSLQPWAFLSDASRNPYNPYTVNTGPLNQSILMPGHNINTDLFTSHNTLRGVPAGFPAAASGLTTTNNYILYDNSGNPLNYMPNQAPPGRGNPPSQTAFYQSIAAAANRQQAQAYNNALHAANAQLRANAVAGMPYQKLDQQTGGKTGVSDAGFTTVPPYNGRANNHSTGPPSPKTKLKMAQQQEQAKLTASMGNMNMNNLNALAQMQRSMQMQGHFNNQLSSLVQQQQSVPGQYNPSPIARPQVSHSQGSMMTGGQLSKQMNHYFNQEGTEAAGDDTLAAEKVDNDEPVEDVVVDAADTAGAQTSEQEAASVAN